MSDIIWIRYRELSSQFDKLEDFPCLRDYTSNEPQENEEKIAKYLEAAPTYCAGGMIVSDVLNPDVEVVLFPGIRTDGLYRWPAELAYYVRKYHVRVPDDLIRRMESFGWIPPGVDGRK